MSNVNLGYWQADGECLKYKIRLDGVDATDYVCRTCCALHNILLHVYDIIKEWDGAPGQFDEEDMHNIPFALQRFTGFTELRSYDTFVMGCGQSIDNDINDNSRSFSSLETTTSKVNKEILRENINNFIKLPMDSFQNKLIDHFDILFK